MTLESYGFAIYISAFALSAVWLCWAFIPDHFLNCIGIIYYPSKYWAATIPSIVIVAYISWFAYYTLSVLIMTHPRQNSASCKDSFTKSFQAYNDMTIPPLCDVSISETNERIYVK